MIADDLFAGAGGWDLAAAKLGVHARGIENMKEARATRDAAELTTIHDDVWTYQPDGKATGLIASPPCQTFSAAGKGSGRKALDDVLRLIDKDVPLYRSLLRSMARDLGDERTALVLAPLHYALRGDYEWLAWEQVPTVLPVWEACAERLRQDGWNVWTGLLQAEMFGVPQTRKRAFLLASRVGTVKPPEPTHSRYYSRDPGKLDLGVKKWVSMAEALGWAPRSDWSMGTTNVHDGAYQSRPISEPAPTVTSAARSFRWGEAPLLVETPGVKGGNMQENRVTEDEHPDFLRMTKMENSAVRSVDEPAPTIAFGHDANSARWFRGDEWMFHRPSTTIVGSFKPEIVAAPGYRTTVSRQNAPNSVRVTVEEAGVLQSFPADFPWQGAKGKQFLQAGNAVPPGLAGAALSAVVPVASEAVA